MEAILTKPVVNETVDHIPFLFERVGTASFMQDFNMDFVASRAFANKMRELCGDAVEITESNAVVRMTIL
jgi:hypothetical protein